MAKDKKTIGLTLNVINIKLHSNTRSGATAYEQIIRELFESKASWDARGDSRMIFRTQFTTKIGENDVIYGKLARFTHLDSNAWLNFDNLEIENFEIPKNKFPNLRETDYYFIPEAHRLCIRISQSFGSIYGVARHIAPALQSVLGSEEEIFVDVEHDMNEFEEILMAKVIEKIEVDISYSNHDLNEESAQLIEAEIKKMGASKIKLSAQSEKGGTLSLESSLLDGSLGLARSNGEVIATVIDLNDKRKKIVTKSFPKRVPLQSEDEDSIPTDVFHKIMNLFRG